MHDRVAEVLAERERLGRGAGAGVAVSVLLHATLTAAAVYAAMHARPPQTVSTLDIRFAPMHAPSAAPVMPAAAPASPPAQPKLKIPAPAAEAPKPLTPAKVEPKTVPLSPFGKSTRKGSEAAPAPAPVAPPAAAAKPGISTDVPVGGSGVTALEGGDFPYTIYIDRMKLLIGQHWPRPPQATGVTATIYFVIDRDGTIRDAKVETSSGSGTFDRAALRAVLDQQQLPPLPFAYNGTFLGVHLTFR